VNSIPVPVKLKMNQELDFQVADSNYPDQLYQKEQNIFSLFGSPESYMFLVLFWTLYSHMFYHNMKTGI
jgi:hypothetical protein